MPENSLEKISRILLPSKQLSTSPKKSFVPFQNSSKDLSDDTVKTKLEACLFGLKNVHQKFKKGIFEDSSNSSKVDIPFSSARNSSKKLQSSLLPRILHDEQKRKLMTEKITKQPLANPTSYLICNSQIINASILKQRLNHTSLSLKQNQGIDFSRTIFPKMMNDKSIQNISMNKTANFNINFKKNIEINTSSSKELQKPKKLQFHPKIKKHLYESAEGKTLSKENRFFSDNPPIINQKEIEKIGLYESSNRYRKELLCKEMNNLSPKVEKKELQIVKVCKQNQLFLTRPKQLEPTELDDFLKGQFVINEAKPKRYFETIKTEEIQKIQTKIDQSSLNSQRKNVSQIPETSYIQDHIAQQINYEQGNTKNLTFLQVKNYSMVKNVSFMKFRVANIEIWDDIESLLRQIIAFVKQLKINSCKFKANNLLNYWSGKKLSIKDMEKILKISRKQIVNRQKSALQSLMSILHAKRKMKSIIHAKIKRLSYMKWVNDRIIGIRSIKKETQYKIKKAHQLHQKLLQGDYTWDTQIYIASFSENAFVRNTTQYMQSFENMFTHMWKESSKHMILVIPTINSQILQIYQEKLKIKRTITLICPQVHELFPANMSLAGCLLFSYESLNKIKQLIEGKNAVIIPGKFSSPKYELLISEFLRTPLMTSLKPRRDLEFQKQLFASANLSVLPYISIRPHTIIDEIIRQFAKLLLSYKDINKWVFKINGEFSGRGLASFCIRSSKVLKSILSSCKDTIKPLEQYLKRNLKLKLKINFENSLFMLGDYLERLAQKGGIIEQQKEQVESYELSFFIQNKLTCSLVACFKCFSVNHSNKAYIYEAYPNPKLSSVLSKLKSILEVNQYLGYVSVNLVIAGDKVYGIEIKPYLTHLTAVEPFIKTIESKRQLKLNLSGQGHEKMENELISSTLRNEFMSKRKHQMFSNGTSFNVRQGNMNRQSTEQSHLFSNINLSTTQLQTIRPQLSDFTYLFIPNIILTDVPIPKKAEFIESIVLESFTRPKFDILDNNLVLYLSNGLSLSLLIVGRQMKKIKKTSIEVVRYLSQKTGPLKIYCGKNEARDVFQFGDIIKAVTQMKS